MTEHRDINAEIIGRKEGRKCLRYLLDLQSMVYHVYFCESFFSELFLFIIVKIQKENH